MLNKLANVLDGKEVANDICGDLTGRCNHLKMKYGITPELRIVSTGNNAASQVYIKNKLKRCEEIGIKPTIIHCNDVSTLTISSIQSDPKPTIFQMPISLTPTVAKKGLSSFISPECDVDGFVSYENVAKLANGLDPVNFPCTPYGIIWLLEEYGVFVEGKSVCILGRSNIVGHPLARMMENFGATVTLCHSKTPFDDVTVPAIKNADIVVSATGVRNILTFEEVQKFGIDLSKKVLVDVGMNRDENGKLCGDFDSALFENCFAYTPVPGGIGPMTVAMLMTNVIEYYERKAGID